MLVYVYRSLAKDGRYLYVKNKDQFDQVPEHLISALGELEFALEFELTGDRKLATEDPDTVLENLKNDGFHLQVNDPFTIQSRLKDISNKTIR